MKVVITRELKQNYMEEIQEAVPDYSFVKATDSDSQEKELIDADILVTFPAVLGVEKIYRAEKVSWIQSWSAGVDTLTKPDVLKYLIGNNIQLTTMSGIHGDVIAEQVMGLIISFSRKLYKCYQQQKNCIWQRPQVSQLAGKTMGIIGLGSVGREIASRAKAFKMTVLGTKRDINNAVENVDKLYSPDELLVLLKESDYVVPAVPLTDETTYMFGHDEFRAMKKTAIFINISRGKVVNEAELIKALEEGMIAGAGLDVFAEEPLPAQSPLYMMENVLITPHFAGIFPDYNKRAVELLIKNLLRYKNGKRLINLVDYNRGY